VQGDGRGIEEARLQLDGGLARRVRERARKLGVSAASMCHVAWGQVLARLTGREDVVFGTVVFGRMEGGAGADRVMGLFINTLPVRVGIGEEGVETSVRRMHRLLAELMRHEHGSLALAQRCSGVEAPAPLFTTLLNYRHSAKTAKPASDEIREAWKGIQTLRIEERTNYPITLSIDDLGEGFVLTAQVEGSVGALRLCEYIRTALEEMVNALERAPGISVDGLNVMPARERRQVMEEWNGTEEVFSCEQCVHELFEEQVRRTPNAVAVVYEGKELTYEELNRRSNQLAHSLRESGVRPDARVAICVERGLEMVMALIAVLKAGGGYVPLDPAYPVERLRYMVEDSAPVVLLTQAHLAERVAEFSRTLQVIDLTEDGSRWKKQADSNMDRASVGVKPEHLAYVIYTSGSTGEPKGVMVEHGNVTRLFRATEGWFGFNESDVWTLFHSYAFDFSVWEMWGALLYGGRLIVIEKDTARSPESFYELLCRSKVTILNQTPSAFRQLMRAQEESGEQHRLRHVIFGGEALEVATLKPWYQESRNQNTRLINMYGITETTVHVTYRELERRDTERRGSPIGKRIPDLKTYILDKQRRPVPVGVVGEMYIGGAGVARGYLNREELTAERFLKDPFSEEAGARMYKTGDLGRWQGDGTIDFVGRNDSQVKVRGYRIELGEIEARLAEYAGIGEAVVIAREDAAGDKRLVAYYTCKNKEDRVEGEKSLAGAEELRRYLGGRLPEYMVPAAYVRLEKLPLTVNGKLDRKALPMPEGDAFAVRGYEAPQGETETRLAAIWAEVLKVERVGRQDNFFSLGGHSLLAVTLMERMRRQGISVDVRTLFAKPTLAELAATAGAQTTSIEVPANLIPLGCEAITPEMLPLVKLTEEEIEGVVNSVRGGAGNVQDIYPLAPLQEGILFHHLIGGEGDPYLLGSLLSFKNRERLDIYVRALQAVIERHDILRTGVVWEGLPNPVQAVWRKAVLPVEEMELDPCAGEVSEQLYERYDPRHYRIDVRQAPLLRAYIAYDEKKDRWLMMRLLHHLAVDHSTVEVMHGEIEAYLLGRMKELPEPLPFRNLVAQARLGVSEQEHEAFFRKMLGDVEEPTAPFGLLNVQGDGLRIKEARIELDSGLASRLRERARMLGVNVASLCHLGWGMVLARVSGREDVVFGTVVFGRMQGGQGTDNVMGLFINTLPVRIRIGEKGAETSVRRMHTMLAELMRHEHASLALAQRCSGVQAPIPLFTALLNYRHSGKVVKVATEEARRAWQGIQGLRAEERSNYPFTLAVDDLGEGFWLTTRTNTSIDPLRAAEFMKTALESLVQALETAPTTTVRSLNVLPATEKHQLLVEWNNTKVEFSGDECMHELFEAQVFKSPHAVAVRYEGKEITYAELNRRANRLAHYLRDLGVKPDTRVAICMERKPEMIVAILAVLKAGGAYVPMDPVYPQDRLRYMLEDSEPRVLLTQRLIQKRFAGIKKELPVLCLTDENSTNEDFALQNQPHTNLARAVTGLASRHLAYVIYTSGSTGSPKGVMIEHRNLSNYLRWADDAYYRRHGFKEAFNTNGSPAIHSIGFDGLVTTLFGPLIAGETLDLLPQGIEMDILGQMCSSNNFQYTLIKVTPSHLKLLNRAISEDGSKAPTRALMIGGEALVPSDVLFWQRRFPDVRLINHFGPTEGTVGCCTFDISAPIDELRSIPIGRPIANTQIYILDLHGQPTPIGVAGELHIAGAGVARGYLNLPELTAEKFVRDPFSADPEARMYKTGDLSRWLADGTIEFLGRNDFQVKIRGFRIELGEIESALLRHPFIREAAVMAREDTPGDLRLVAYYSTVSGKQQTGWVDGVVGAEQLRAYLAEALPEYMVPAAYVRMEKLPLTVNGKLDRKALPVPEGDAFAARGYEVPQGEIETRLAGIWAEILKLEKVGRHDNFFALGGHSLLAVRVVTRLQQAFNVDLPLVDLFARPVLASLAEQIVKIQLEQFDPEDLAQALKLMRGA
jgi:amino acid adenylation domain-containing protein